MYTPSRFALLAAAIYALPATAQQNANSDITTTYSGNSCPNGQVSYQRGGNGDSNQYCCPGTIFGEEDSPFCCVGGKFEVQTPSFASCFPTCTGSDASNNGAANGVTNVPTSTQPCATSIFFSDSNYSSLASAAAQSLSSGSSSAGSGGIVTSDGTTIRSTIGSSTGAASTGSSSSGSGSASSAAGQSTGGAAAMITSGPMLGGIVAAGGLLMAL